MTRHPLALFVLALVGSMAGASRSAAQEAGAKAPAAPAAVAPAAIAPAPAAQTPASKPAPKPAIYDEKADGKTLVAAALAHAGKDNRRVLIQWGGNWCPWCHLLHELCTSNADLKHELLYEYDVVLLDIGKWDKNMDLAASYGADLKGTGVPYLTVLAADGSVLANQETSVLEAKIDGKDGHDPAKVLEFLKAHQAPYLDAATIYQNALAQAGRDGKRVFLHFGAPWCGWCHKLENWMAEPRVAELLGRDFVDCKIDQDRTTGGKQMLAQHRGSEAGGIPWFQFVAADGSVLADSNGPKGNTGFPAAPEEIEHFGTMLNKAALHLSAADIAELLASLQPKADPAHAATGPTAPASGTR